jgi:L-seryl-tRNA(Ser) seleniumtransferase
MQEILRKLPSVEAVVQRVTTRDDFSRIDRGFVVYCARKVLTRWREEILRGNAQVRDPSREWLLEEAAERTAEKVWRALQPGLRRVINATGVILHTGLGRAPLAADAVEQLNEVARYCNLEWDLKRGQRGERLDHVEDLLCFLSGAEAAAVVNNNAGAVFLALNTLAPGREVIISRGQLIEIGGSFRLPDVMAQSGAIMREVGTTNKTHFSDYEAAISEKTGAILVAHSSNYRILGFTEEVPVARLVDLAHRYGIPLIYDLGGGVFLDLVQFGLPYEPVVPQQVKLGVDVVTFSGDKVLGGPQSGILVGKKELIEKIRRNPLMRTLRCDKLILAALEATLRLYLQPQKLQQKVPVFRMLLEPVDEQQKRAEWILNKLGAKAPKTVRIHLREGTAQIGSGALPLAEIPSVVLRLESGKMNAHAIARHFRSWKVPVIGYIQEDGFLLNLRTVADEEAAEIVQAIGALP